MARLKYEEKVENLSKVINIAIRNLEQHPPKGFDKNHLEQFINTYLDLKNNALNPKPQHKNTTSLKYIENDVFTYFQEGFGEAVNVFWEEVKEEKLPYKRINKISKILKRKKIKSQLEYDFITDVIVPYQKEGLIDNQDLESLNKMISDFENK